MNVYKVTLPAFLASALVNGDTSGIEQADLRLLEEIEERLATFKGRVVDVEDEPYFGRASPSYAPHFLGDVADYTVLAD